MYQNAIRGLSEKFELVSHIAGNAVDLAKRIPDQYLADIQADARSYSNNVRSENYYDAGIAAARFAYKTAGLLAGGAAVLKVGVTSARASLAAMRQLGDVARDMTLGRMDVPHAQRMPEFDGLYAGSGSVIPIVAGNAVVHEMAVTNYLRNLIGHDNFGSQVHLNVELPGGEMLRIIPDGIERLESGAFRLHDAKFGYDGKDMLALDLAKSFTVRQVPAFEAISNGAARVTIANSKAGASFFGTSFRVGRSIQIEPSIYVYVNTPEGVVLRKYP